MPYEGREGQNGEREGREGHNGGRECCMREERAIMEEESAV